MTEPEARLTGRFTVRSVREHGEAEPGGLPGALWWHVYADDTWCVQMTLGSSPMDPETLVRDPSRLVLSIGDCLAYALSDESYSESGDWSDTVRYRRSYDHEPTDEELERLRA